MGLQSVVTIQSENFVPESKPGAGDGKGWRLDKNGDFQIGTMRMIDGVLYSPHATLHIDRAMVDSASIAPAQLDMPIHRVHGDRIPHKGGLTDMEIVIKVDLPGVIDEMTAERKSALHQEIVDLVRDAAGVPRYAITKEMSVRAEADMALASRIGGMQLGKEFLAIPQPGGDVTLGRLGGGPVSVKDLVGSMQRLQKFRDKPGHSEREFAGGLMRDPLKGIYRDILPTKEFLAENVGTNLKPEVACALSMCAPMTANGKPPLNILPREIDDCK